MNVIELYRKICNLWATPLNSVTKKATFTGCLEKKTVVQSQEKTFNRIQITAAGVTAYFHRH